MNEEDEFMKELAMFLDRMSEKVGEVINEYHWREFCSFRVELENRFKFNVHELQNRKGREDPNGLHQVAPGAGEY